MGPSRAGRTLTAASLALVVTTATGCGGFGGGSSSDGATAWALTGGSEEAFRASFNSWNEANPDREINVEWFANDAYKEKIRTAVGAGNAPTLVFNWSGGTLADYTEADQVVDLSGQVDGLTENVLPSVAANGETGDGLYAVPNNQTQPIVLYYNKKVLADAGVEPPETLDDMTDAVEALKGEGVVPIALAGQSVWPELMWIQYLTDRIGGPETFQRILDGEEGAWSDPAVMEAATAIADLVEAGAFGDSFGSVDADSGADTALLHTGKAGMLLQGSWVYPNMAEDAPEFVGDDLGHTTFPVVDGGSGSPSNIVGNPANFWSVSADASEEEQQTAIDYLNDQVYNEENVQSLLDLGSVPPVSGLEDEIAAQDDSEHLDFTYGMVRDAEHFQLSWDQALPPDQAQELLSNLSRLFLGEITPEEFGATMDQTL
ncbi:carbohydrate ABC transporter substrate-binding protein (CUT1 family) [Haloactinospora alba]|uniref:Carbohydrate ABC transporter substrate-binding protein (CUT1 family) n=1 Tax=Haloactinospora alba TaxID=405555 RepID=A0A543N957_9ACTN|nr:extracellular solute-binding protein [Haloactinospora alba]TQN28348.1 carbohydrate ABC transporter substrate-binding protein (CUT1 family) [Haloactinospora alba]